MKPYSITRRVVSLVLGIELMAAAGVTAFAFFYERHAHFRSFDIGLRGRADTVMGAVQEADDSKLGIMLDTADLKMPQRDVYAVLEESGQVLGQSPDWRPEQENWRGPTGYLSLKVHSHSYRGIRLAGVRVVDPDSDNVRHRLIVLYASPTAEVWEEVFGAVQVFALANGLLVLLTALLVPLLVRRSMNPLHSLAKAASGITASAWHFSPQEEVRAVAELRPLVEAMEGVILRLERSFTQQQQFVGDAAHELKTAVAVVKSSIQLLELRARTPVEYEVGLKRCYADCLRMEDLSQKMLLMARVDETGASPAQQQADLSAGVEAAITELTPLAVLRGVSFVAKAESSAKIAIGQELLRSLLVNLLTNAVQHSPAEAVVQVSLRRSGDSINLQVEDNGEGIEPWALPFVFDRFYRGDPSRSRNTGGTGLGLAICKAIVHRAQGSIYIDSVLGTGTTVMVTLPVLDHTRLEP